jgi:hypothetical protein
MRIAQEINNMYMSHVKTGKKAATGPFTGNGPRLDNAFFSASGRAFAGKLVINTGNIATGSLNSARSLSDPSMRLMGQSIIEVGEILEKMKTLADQASDSELSRDERIDMQIEMINLQVELYEKAYGMGLSLAQAGPDVWTGGDIYAWRNDAITRLERMRKYGSDTPNDVVIDLYDSSGKKNGTMVTFSVGDFELDEDGGLKIRDDIFELLPDSQKSSLDNILHMFAGGNSFFTRGGQSGEDLVKNWSLSLLSHDSAEKTGEKIAEQISLLKEVEAEFNRMATVDPRVASELSAAGTQGNGSLRTRLGIMTHNPENPLDVRLSDTDDPIGRFFQKLDRVFKDKIVKAFGYVENSACLGKASGVSAAQLEKINWYQEKLASAEPTKIPRPSENRLDMSAEPRAKSA